MYLRRAQQHLLAVVAVLALAFAALSPALAAALGQASPVTWVELCSSQGVKRIAVDANGDPVSADEHSARMSEHCPFCHVEHSPLDLPPAPAAVAPQVVAHAEFPALFYAAPRPLHAWAPTRSRAPPLN